MRPIANGRAKRLLYVGAGVVALAIPITAVALAAGSVSSSAHSGRTVSPRAPRVVASAYRSHRHVRTAKQRGCRKLFTVKMGEGAANLIFSGTRKVTLHEFKVLGNIERCQRNPAAQGFVRGYDHRHRHRHHHRVKVAKAAAAARAQAAAQQAALADSEPSESTSVAAAGGSPLPTCTWEPESGGDPHAVNPSSGAGGYYQIMPSTWAAYGGSGAPQDAPLSEQTAIAQKIWDTQGPSAWVNC